MSDLIQQLKDNEKPFGLMTEEMRAKAEEIGSEYFWCYENTSKQVWGTLSQFNEYNFGQELTYRLRPDYTEKPKVVEVPVEVGETTGLGYVLGSFWCTLNYAINRPDFIGFKYEDEFFDIHPRLYVHKTGNGKKCKTYMLDSEISDYEVLTPTHVLFKESE